MLTPTSKQNAPGLAPVSQKSSWGQLSQASAQGLALRGGADRRSMRPGPRGRKSSKRRKWSRGQKERGKREHILWETKQPGWGELAFPLNKDLFFSAWGWGPENSPAILDPCLLSPLESCEGTKENKALLLPSGGPGDRLCQTEV